MIEIKNEIYIDEDVLIFQAMRSSGPGGQHVNKVSSKIVLICPIEKIAGLSETQQDLIKQKLKSYLFGEEIRVTSQKHRSQYSNRLDAIEKLKTLLQKALKEKKPRYKTKIPRAAKEKRLKKKNIRSEIKKGRTFKVNTDE